MCPDTNELPLICRLSLFLCHKQHCMCGVMPPFHGAFHFTPGAALFSVQWFSKSKRKYLTGHQIIRNMRFQYINPMRFLTFKFYSGYNFETLRVRKLQNATLQ